MLVCDQIAHMEVLYGTGVYGMMSGMETTAKTSAAPKLTTAQAYALYIQSASDFCTFAQFVGVAKHEGLYR